MELNHHTSLNECDDLEASPLKMGCYVHCPGSLSVSGIKHSDQNQHNGEEGLFQHILLGHSPTVREVMAGNKDRESGLLAIPCSVTSDQRSRSQGS